jgi:hypothetical protein
MDNRTLAKERRIEKEMAALQAMAYSKDPKELIEAERILHAANRRTRFRLYARRAALCAVFLFILWLGMSAVDEALHKGPRADGGAVFLLRVYVLFAAGVATAFLDRYSKSSR